MDSVSVFSKYSDYEWLEEGFDKKGFLKEIAKSTNRKAKSKSKVSKKGGLADLYEGTEEAQPEESGSDFYNKYTSISRLL